MRRALKIGAFGLAGLLLLLVVLVGALLLFGNTDSGRRTVEALTDRLSGHWVKIEGLHGSFPQHLFIDELTLTDSAGVWLTAHHIEISWSPLKYLTSGLWVDDGKVESLSMERLPQGSKGPPSKKEVRIPRIDVSHAHIGSAHLGKQLAGADATLVLDGSAHLRSLSDMLFDVDANRIDGDGEYHAHLHFDAVRMDASLKLHEPAGGPLEHIIALPGLGDLDVDASFTGPRDNEQLSLNLRAGALTAKAQGSLNLKDIAADLMVDATAGAMTPRADLQWKSAELHGRWHGSLKTVNADAEVKASEVHLPGSVGLGNLNGSLKAVQGLVEASGRLERLKLPGPVPDLFSGSPIEVEANLKLNDATLPLSVRARHALASFQGESRLARPQSAKGTVRVSDLLPFAELVGERIRGSAVLNGDFKVADGKGVFTLDGAFELQPGAQFWSRAVGGKPTLRATANFAGSTFTLDGAKLVGQSLTATGSGALSSRDAGALGLKAQWGLEVSDLRSLSAALAGTARASGSLQGATDDFAAEAMAEASVSVRGAPSGDLTAHVKTQGLPKLPAGSITASGSLDQAPLELAVDLSQNKEGTLHTLLRSFNWKSLSADGEVNTHAGASRGELKARFGNLADLKHLLSLDLSGSVDATLAFSPEGNHTKLELHVDSPDLRLADQAGAVRASLTGPTDDLQLVLDAGLPQWRGAPLNLKATGRLDLDGSELTFTQFEADYRKQAIKLLEPVRLSYDSGLDIDHLKLGAGQAELELQGAILPDAALRISVRKVTPEFINGFFPDLLASGSIEAHAELHGDLRAPVGQVELNARGMRSADDAAVGLPAADLRVTADLNGRVATLDANLQAGDESKLTATGDVPLIAEAAFDLKIEGKTSVRLLNPLLEARGQHADGSLDVDATVRGKSDDPEIAGNAHLVQASWRDYARGMSLTNIGADIEGGQGSITLKSFSASAAPGSLSATGSVGVLKPKIPVDLKITAKNAQPIASKLITANFDGELTLSGTARERMNVAGNVHLNRTLIGIPNGLPPNVAVLDVRRRGKPQKIAPAKPVVIGLDVTVDAPQQILVQGRGLDAEMFGNLHITGTTDDPVVSGEFDKQRGTFTLASSRMDISSGRVSFNGSGLQNRIDPTLDFEATTDVRTPQGETVNITLAITGYADAPRFDLRSDKYAAGPDEILALLMFGASPQNLSGLQLAQIGAALATLSGVGGDGSLNPLVKLQKSLGLDRLSLTSAPTAPGSTESSGAAIEAGRYISKRVYIEAKQSTNGYSQLQADVDITKRLKLQTRLGNGTATVQGTTPENDPGSSIGLIYQFEY